MFKTQKIFKFLFALLIIISISIPVFSAKAQESASISAAKRTVTNYQIPCASGTVSNLTTTHDGGSLSRYAYDWRCDKDDKAIRDVYAPHAGVVKLTRYYNNATKGMVFIYDKGNDACAVLLHLESSFSVKVGDSVTTSTKIGKYTYGDGHVHMAVFPGQCISYSHSNELPIIFNEIGNVPSQKITLSNSLSYISKKNLSSATAKAFVSGVSSITINNDAVNLKVSADNLNGKTVYWQMWRPATNGFGEKEWHGQANASGNSVSFTNLDGAGSVFDKVTYYTVASLNPIDPGQAKQQRTSCASATGQKQFCDAISLSPAVIIMPTPVTPTSIPLSAFVNGSSSLTITANSVNLKVSADNLNGKMVYGQMWRTSINGNPEKVWGFSGTATSNSLSFNDLDGAGPVFEGITYYTVVSLSVITDGQAKLQRTSCAAATGQTQFCDAVTYSGPAASACTPGKSVDNTFMRAVINTLNTQTEYPISNIEFATQAMHIWQRYEGTTACWNPLATTWGRPGATNFNSIGVKNYITVEDGVAATANTIGTKNTAASYSAIRQMLALKTFDEAGIAANLKQYSGGGGYVTNVMNEWRTLYNQYRGGNVATTGDVFLYAGLSCPSTAEVGTSIDCTLSINPNNTAISGLQINLSGFESALKHTDTQFTEIAGNDPINLSASGKIVWAGSNGSLISTQGTLATLSFDVLQAGTVNISGNISAVDENNAVLTMKFSGTTVDVQSDNPPPR